MKNCIYLAEVNRHPRDRFLHVDPETHSYWLLDASGNKVRRFSKSVTRVVQKAFEEDGKEEFNAFQVIATQIHKWEKNESHEYHQWIKKVKNEIFFSKTLFAENSSSWRGVFSLLLQAHWATQAQKARMAGKEIHRLIEIFLNETAQRKKDFQKDAEVLKEKNFEKNALISEEKYFEIDAEVSEENISSIPQFSQIDAFILRLKILFPDITDATFVLFEKNLLHHLNTLSLFSPPSSSSFPPPSSSPFYLFPLSQVVPLSIPIAPDPSLDAFSFEVLKARRTDEYRGFCEWIQNRRESGINWVPYRTEWSVYSEALNLAGQIDALFISESISPKEESISPKEESISPKEEKGKKRFLLVDWKRTSPDDKKKGFFESSSENVVIGSTSLPRNKKSHYCLQLNLYALILEKEYQIQVDEMVIVQLFPSKKPFQDPSKCFFEEIIVPRIV